ncbi:MAG: flagellar basal-body rod protein FlgG [Hyphomicrobiales bacterium]
MKALQIAATGMMAQQLNVEVISHNIANMRTTGYKRIRPEFQDLLYQNLRPVGASSSENGTVLPSGIQIGLGVKTASTYRIMTQGDMTNTEKQLDIAIRGEGFFQVQLPGGQTAYTRSGAFALDANGQLVTQEGYQVEPSITVPQNARQISINAAGEVQVTIDGQTAPQTVGTLELARFVNKAGLEAIGDNLFLETAASGTPTTGTPNSDGVGSVLQNFLEHSNVNAVSEISDLIAAQRAYEMNARVISAADEMMSATSQLR